MLLVQFISSTVKNGNALAPLNLDITIAGIEKSRNTYETTFVGDNVGLLNKRVITKLE